MKLENLLRAYRNLRMESKRLLKKIYEKPEAAFLYAVSSSDDPDLRERLPKEVESLLAGDANWAIPYACEILYQRWPLAEEKLKEDKSAYTQEYLEYLDQIPESKYPLFVIEYLKVIRGICGECGDLLPRRERDRWRLEDEDEDICYCSEKCAYKAEERNKKFEIRVYIESLMAGDNYEKIEEAFQYVLGNGWNSYEEIDSLLEKGGFI